MKVREVKLIMVSTNLKLAFEDTNQSVCCSSHSSYKELPSASLVLTLITNTVTLAADASKITYDPKSLLLSIMICISSIAC